MSGDCLIQVDDATGDLLPNTNVTVNVTTQQVHGVPTIPREALRTTGFSPTFVYVLAERERSALRPRSKWAP